MDSILSDEPSVHTMPDEPADKPEAESTAPEAKSEPAEKQAAAPKEAPKPTETVSDDDSEDSSTPADLEGFKKALAAARGDKRTARKKWQEVERQKAMLEGELAALRRQAQQPAPQPQQAQTPEDPDGEFWTAGPDKFWQTREQRLREQFEQTLSERERRTEIEIDRRVMRRQFEDFDEAEKAFAQAIQSDKSLHAEFAASADKVRFAYEHGKKALAAQDEKARARVYAELRSKGIDPEAPQQPARTPIPPKSIASARGSSPGVTPAYSGPRSMEDILGRH